MHRLNNNNIRNSLGLSMNTNEQDVWGWNPPATGPGYKNASLNSVD